MKINQASKNDLFDLLTLYTQLHDNPLPQIDDTLLNLYDEILSTPNHYIIIGKENDTIITSCVLVIIPNLTHGQLPYALVENVVTHNSYRGQGYATQILNYAKEIAINKHCYKIMLMTGSKEESTMHFYKKAGYNSEDKTAFIQWL